VWLTAAPKLSCGCSPGPAAACAYHLTLSLPPSTCSHPLQRAAALEQDLEVLRKQAGALEQQVAEQQQQHALETEARAASMQEAEVGASHG